MTAARTPIGMLLQATAADLALASLLTFLPWTADRSLRVDGALQRYEVAREGWRR
jgi:hypothetical protein